MAVRSWVTLFLYLCDMKVYIVTIMSDGALVVLSAFRNRSTAVQFFDEHIRLDVEDGYIITEDYSDLDVDNLRHVELLKDDATSPSYDFDLWALDVC